MLLFHRIPEAFDPLVPDELLLRDFEYILDFLQDSTHVLPLSDAVSGVKRGKLPRNAVALTFDDGYADWIRNVCPSLLRRNLPATFFVTTEQLDGAHLWHERIVAAVRALPDQVYSLPLGRGGQYNLSSVVSRALFVQDLQQLLKYVSLEERVAAIESIEGQAQAPLVYPQRFDAQALRYLDSCGFEIGAHTIRHPILNREVAGRAFDEIGGCRETLEALIGGKVKSFAYPNGRPVIDYEQSHVDMVRRCGYEFAVSTGGGCVRAGSDRFQLPRYTVWHHAGKSLARSRLAYQLARHQVAPEVAGNDPQSVRCLFVASTFAPVHGGSAVVYEGLCREMPAGSVRVLAPRRSYLTHEEIPEHEAFDRAAKFPIDRVDLLRPLMLPPPANTLVSLWRFIGSDIPLYLGILFRAMHIVRRHRINVVCIGELVTGTWLGLALRKLFGCKLIVYVHGEEVTTKTSGRLHGNKRHDYLHAADLVVSVSEFTSNVLRTTYGMSPEKLVLIQNGVDTERFFPGTRSPGIVERHSLQNRKLIVTVGRLVPRKGIDKAIEALANVVEKNPAVHYAILGSGEYRAELESMVEALGLQSYVTFLGAVSDAEVLAYLQTCDFFLMPNRTMPDGDTEGFGLVFREANACAKPVIGGAAGGAVEAVAHMESGLLVDGNSTEAISEAILSLLTDEKLASKLGTGGLQLAKDNSTRNVTKRFFDACAALVSNRIQP